MVNYNNLFYILKVLFKSIKLCNALPADVREAILLKIFEKKLHNDILNNIRN